MPFNGSGTFVRVHDWTTDAGNGFKIAASRMDAEHDSFAAGLSAVITVDGQSTITNNIPFNNNRITGLANPVGAQDAATKAYVDSTAVVTLEMYGAAGDGTTNDLPALTAALASGRPIDGFGRTYAVDGQVTLAAGASLSRITLKQLSPTSTRTTLSATSVNNLRLVDVTVDRNGDGTNDGGASAISATSGALATAYGVDINGGTGHHFERLTVTGDDTGTGMRFQSLDGTSKIISPRAVDITGELSTATDDTVQGIFFALCDGLSVYNAEVRNLLWTNGTDAATNQNTRGIVASGCRSLTLVAPSVDNVGQGIDFTGDLGSGNSDCRVIAADVVDCGTFGVKFANLTRRTKAIGSTSLRCGLSGFVDSSSFNTVVNDFDGNKFIDCDALDCGSGTGTNGGFLKLQGSRTYSNFPTFIRCRAADRRETPLMTFGFYTEGTPRGDAVSRVIDCISEGLENDVSALHFSGFTTTRVRGAGVASSTANAADTYIASTALRVPAVPEQRAGMVYRASFFVSKTAAGIATPSIRVRLGAAGAIADTSIAEAVAAAQTAAVSEGRVDVEVSFRIVGASAAGMVYVTIYNEGGTVGIANTPLQIIRVSPISADLTSPLFIGISVNPGTAGVWTIFSPVSQWLIPDY